MTLLNYTFNYALDNGFLFWGAFAGTVGFIGYKFTSSYLSSFYVEKEVQTEAWEDYSNRPSQIGSNSVTSIDTIKPISENISPVSTLQTTSEVGTQTITDGASTVTTILPIPPVNIEMIPNPDITQVTKSLVDQGVQIINVPLTDKELTKVIEAINNRPSFFLWCSWMWYLNITRSFYDKFITYFWYNKFIPLIVL